MARAATLMLGMFAVGCCPALPRTLPALAPSAPLPPASARVSARATLELAEPTAEDLGGPDAVLPGPLRSALAAPPRSRADALETWALVLSSRSVRDPAGLELGSAIDPDEIGVERRDRVLSIVVEGDSAQAAVARCTAVLKAAERVGDEGRERTRAWLRDELRRTDRELEEARRDAPVAELAAGEPFDEALARVRGTAADLAAASSADALLAMAAPTVPADLRALAEILARAEQDAVDLAAQYGDQHLGLRQMRRRVEVLTGQVESQRTEEIAQTEADRAALEATPARDRSSPVAAFRARTRALLETIARQGRTVGQGVPSGAPPMLRRLAAEWRQAALEREVMSLRYGDRHPDRIVVEVRQAALATAFEAERARVVELLQARLAARPSVPVASEAQRAAAAVALLEQQLVSIAERLVRLEAEEESAPRYRIVDRCSAE